MTSCHHVYLYVLLFQMKKHPLLELVTTKEQNISGCPKKYEMQKLFKVSVQCLYWWAMKPFFSQATMLMQDLETKKARHAVLKNKLMLQGVGEEMSEDAGLQSLADSSQYPQRENNVRDVFDKKTPRNDQQGNRFSNQFTFFSKKLAFHSFSKIQVYFVMFLSPSGNVSVCV